jgi:hypothetical protein
LDREQDQVATAEVVVVERPEDADPLNLAKVYS